MPSRKPSTRRILVFVLTYFMGFALILGGGLLYAAIGPAEYLIRAEALPIGAPQVKRFGDGSVVRVFVYPDGEQAKAGQRKILDPIRMRSVSNIADRKIRYTNENSGQTGLLLRVDRVIVHIEAARRAAVDERLADLAFLQKNPDVNVLDWLFDRHLGVGFALMGMLVLVMATFFLFGAPWAARIAPPAGSPAASADEVRRRLLLINTLDLPWRLEERGLDRLRAEWVFADARWIEAIGSGSINESQRLDLRIDPVRRRVLMIESSRSVSHQAGLTSFSWSWSFWRGISFAEVSLASGGGLLFRDGRWQVVRAYRYRFDVDEMKGPLIDATLDAGWTWSPVMTFVRWLGG